MENVTNREGSVQTPTLQYDLNFGKYHFAHRYLHLVNEKIYFEIGLTAEVSGRMGNVCKMEAIRGNVVEAPSLNKMPQHEVVGTAAGRRTSDCGENSNCR